MHEIQNIPFQYIYIVHLESDFFVDFQMSLYNFSCLGHFTYCVIPLILRGSHPSQINSLGEHTGLPSHMRQYLFLSFGPSMQHSLAHSLMADRSTVVGHVLMDHTCSFMCTSHIDMTAHMPAFLQVGEQSGNLLYAHMT